MSDLGGVKRKASSPLQGVGVLKALFTKRVDAMSDKEAAKMLYKRGCELAKDGAHSEAFLRFSKAYDLDSNPAFLAAKILSVFKAKSSGEGCEEIESFLSSALQYVDDIFNDISKLILSNATKAELLSQSVFFLPLKAYILNVLEYYQKAFELTHDLDYLVKKIIFCLDTAISQYNYQKIQVHFNEALKYTLDLEDERSEIGFSDQQKQLILNQYRDFSRKEENILNHYNLIK